MKPAPQLSILVSLLSIGTLAADFPPSNSSQCGNSSVLTVEISTGTLHGAFVPSNSCVRQFRGIPYGRAPIGDLRFEPPQPALPFGDIEVKKYAPSCPQYLMEIPPTIYTRYVPEYNLEGLNITSPNLSEDCLTLSVWSPANAPSEQGGPGFLRRPLLPVLIYVYGGAFLTGGEDVPAQIPTQWIERTDAHIVVIANYRLNIFGFPNARGQPLEKQNLGLLDQRLAVEWVRDNIAAFGGDPNRITLWGQSAGAISVGFYQYAHAEDPIAKAFIMDSGSELLPIAFAPKPAFSNFTFVASQLGCGNLSAEAELACMKGTNITAKMVEDVIQDHNQNHFESFLFFRPVVDGINVFADYVAKARAGEIAKLPTILGANKDDGSAFVIMSPDGGVNQTLADIMTQYFFFCPSFHAANIRVQAGVPTYRYEYYGNFSDVSPEPWMGAYHTAELPMIFGTYGDFRASTDTAADRALENATSRAMQDAWLAIASAGTAGLASQDWPPYTTPNGGGAVRKFGVEGPVPGDGGFAAVTGNTVDMEKACPALASNATATRRRRSRDQQSKKGRF